MIARRMTAFAALISLFCSAPGIGATQGGAAGGDFGDWARRNARPVSVSTDDLSDLEPLRAMIGDARIVSLGEGQHGSAEPLEFRNRLFRFLVEEMGFTAIALESGVTAGFSANDYVQGGPGDAEAVARGGITSGLGGFPQQAALLRWMRGYNSNPAHQRKITFYGMDIAGAAADPDSALEIALSYLDGVDPTAAGALRERLRPDLPHLRINRMRDDPDHYTHLALPRRDAVTAAIADLVARFEVKEGAYIAATSPRRYAIAYRAAVAARYADDYLRQYPVGWTPADVASGMNAVAVADRAKTDNIEWILRQLGPEGRLLIFSHFGHAAPTPVTIQFQGRTVALPPMMGEYLKRRYGPRLVTIGHLLARDAGSCAGEQPPAAPTSIQGQLARASTAPAFLLDLRGAPPAAAQRLHQPHDLYGQRITHSLNIGEGADILFFTQRVTPASPCP